jgi:ABC-2 type transport system permease protein
MNDLALLGHQIRYENRSFWRNPPSAFFTIVFPLMFLFLINSIFGNDRIPGPSGPKIAGSTLYIPMIATFSLITACFTNLAISLPFARDFGTLKRVRGTPLPPHIYMLGRIVHATLIALMLVAITIVVGALVYSVDVQAARLPAFLISVLVGATAFSSLGLAMAAAVPNADASPAVVNGVVLPLFFISGVFIPTANLPEWLVTISAVFPVKNLGDALAASFDPFAAGSGFQVAELAVVGVWGVAGLIIAVRFFSWEPRR